MNGQITIRFARASAGSAGPSARNARTLAEKLIKSDKSFVLLAPKECNWLAKVLHFLRSRPHHPQLAERP